MDSNYQESIFDKTFSDLGGIYKSKNNDIVDYNYFSYYKSRANQYIESAIKHRSLKKDIASVYFDYIDNPSLNAIAAKTKNNLYLIGINTGAILILQDIYLRMLSSSQILPNIGNPKTENVSTPTIRNYYVDASLLVEFGPLDYSKYQLPQPLDITRKIYAQHLAEIAIDFLVAHELTHILNGHLDYLQSNLNCSFYNERDPVVNTEKEILDRQTLEMDADCIATSIGISNAVRRHLQEQSVTPDRYQFYNSFEDTIFNWSLATIILTRLSDESTTYRHSNENLGTHPNPRVRQTMLLATINEFLNKYYPTLITSEFSLLAGEVMKTSEVIYRIITGNKIEKEYIVESITNGQYYSSKVLKNWQSLKYDLDRFTYSPLVGL